jgi:hypothetical protein
MNKHSIRLNSINLAHDSIPKQKSQRGGLKNRKETDFYFSLANLIPRLQFAVKTHASLETKSKSEF